MPFKFSKFLGSCALALFLISPASAADLKDRASDLGLEPHRALYDIRLVSSHSGSQVVNISGQMFYEWQTSCDAWISNHRFNILYEYADSMPMRVASDFSTYELFDGKGLNFTSQRKRDNQLFEELRGSAYKDEAGGKAEYTLPPGQEYELPAGTYFPMGHSVALAEHIKAGKTIFNAVLFDGSDEEGPVEVNTFIGKPLKGEAAKFQKVNTASIEETLLDSPVRKVRMAFFPLNQDGALSDYEMSMLVQDNGIIRNMEIEYDDFTISQTLLALEATPEGCKKQRFNP